MSGNRKHESLNPGTNESETTLTGLEAARVGSTATAILLFAATSLSGSGQSTASTAADGTVISILRAGLYEFRLRGTSGGANGTVVATSINTDTAGLTATPSVSVVGAEDFAQFAGDDAAGNPAALNTSGVFAIRNSDIATGRAAGHDGAALRVHANIVGGGAPAGVAVSSAIFKLRRIGSIT